MDRAAIDAPPAHPGAEAGIEVHSAFTSADHLTLRGHRTLPVGREARSRVVVVHGFGDHSRALPYRNLTRHLVERGHAAYGFDLRGHGRSDGTRMFVERWGVLRDDLRVFMEGVGSARPARPVFVVGLSLGGLLALNYAQHHPDGLRGLVAAAPALDASGTPAAIRLALPILSLLAPRASLDPRLDLAGISRDVDSVRDYTSDPLWQTRTTCRLAAETMGAIAETLALAPSLTVPLLTLHGAADSIVPPRGSEVFHLRAGSADKCRQLYEGALHNLFIETNRQQVLGDIGDWIEERL